MDDHVEILAAWTITAFLFSIVGPIAGIGLMRRAKWGYVLAFLCAVLAIVTGPLGFVYSLYAIWVLTRSGTLAQFRFT